MSLNEPTCLLIIASCKRFEFSYFKLLWYKVLTLENDSLIPILFGNEFYKKTIHLSEVLKIVNHFKANMREITLNFRTYHEELCDNDLTDEFIERILLKLFETTYSFPKSIIPLKWTKVTLKHLFGYKIGQNDNIDIVDFDEDDFIKHPSIIATKSPLFAKLSSQLTHETQSHMRYFFKHLLADLICIFSKVTIKNEKLISFHYDYIWGPYNMELYLKLLNSTSSQRDDLTTIQLSFLLSDYHLIRRKEDDDEKLRRGMVEMSTKNEEEKNLASLILNNSKHQEETLKMFKYELIKQREKEAEIIETKWQHEIDEENEKIEEHKRILNSLKFELKMKEKEENEKELERENERKRIEEERKRKEEEKRIEEERRRIEEERRFVEERKRKEEERRIEEEQRRKEEEKRIEEKERRIEEEERRINEEERRIEEERKRKEEEKRIEEERKRKEEEKRIEEERKRKEEEKRIEEERKRKEEEKRIEEERKRKEEEKRIEEERKRKEEEKRIEEERKRKEKEERFLEDQRRKEKEERFLEDRRRKEEERRIEMEEEMKKAEFGQIKIIRKRKFQENDGQIFKKARNDPILLRDPIRSSEQSTSTKDYENEKDENELERITNSLNEILNDESGELDIKPFQLEEALTAPKRNENRICSSEFANTPSTSTENPEAVQSSSESNSTQQNSFTFNKFLREEHSENIWDQLKNMKKNQILRKWLGNFYEKINNSKNKNYMNIIKKMKIVAWEIIENRKQLTDKVLKSQADNSFEGYRFVHLIMFRDFMNTIMEELMVLGINRIYNHAVPLRWLNLPVVPFTFINNELPWKLDLEALSDEKTMLFDGLGGLLHDIEVEEQNTIRQNVMEFFIEVYCGVVRKVFTATIEQMENGKRHISQLNYEPNFVIDFESTEEHVRQVTVPKTTYAECRRGPIDIDDIEINIRLKKEELIEKEKQRQAL